MNKMPAIHTSHLFEDLNGYLVALLTSLAPDDWNKPTVCSLWTVKDIASHLLDGNIRRLAAQRDGYLSPDTPRSFASQQQLVSYLNQLNVAWTQATRRMSPRTLVELLELTGTQVALLFEATDPDGPALYPVSWAGDEHSPMWFDIAREYTERWHHQRQIADAVGVSTPLDGRHMYYPVLDTFMRALPFTYRDVPAPDGTIVSVRVIGEAGGQWHICYRNGKWVQVQPGDFSSDATLTIGQEVAWKAFTKRRACTTPWPKGRSSRRKIRSTRPASSCAR